MKIRTLVILLLMTLVSTIALSACDDVSAQINYKPPFLPIVFSLHDNGTISVAGDASVVTPIGDFEVEAGGYTAEATATPPPDSLVLIIRHIKSGKAVDTVYDIAANGEELAITTDGLTQINVTAHQVFIDATKSKIKSITFKDTRPLQYSLGDPSEHYGVRLDWSPDGNLMAVTDTSTIQVFDTHTAQTVKSLSNGQDNFAPLLVAWSHDGKYLASETSDRQIYVFDAKSGAVAQHYADPTGSSGLLTSLAWSPDNRYLADSYVPDSTTFLGTATVVFEAHTGKVIATHPGFITTPHCNWSPDGKYLVTDDRNSDGDSTQVWNALSALYTPVHTFSDSGNPCYSPNGTRIAVASYTGDIHLLNTATWKQAADFQGHDATQIFQFVWSPDGTRIMSAKLGDDSNKVGSSVEVWNAKTGATIVTYRFPYQTYQSDNKTYSYQLSDAEWSPNSQSVATLFINTVKIQPGSAG